MERIIGKTVQGWDPNIDLDVIFTLWFTDGSYMNFSHTQDCCESVYMCDHSDEELLNSLIGGLVVSAEEIITCDDTATASWYKIRTDRSDVTLMFRGESNGYYSESVGLTFVDAC